MKWKNEKENLEKLINQGLAYEEIGKQYSCTGANIKKVARRLGIELKPRRKINECETFNRGTAKKGVCQHCGKEFILYKEHHGKFCSHECFVEHRKGKTIQDWEEGVTNGCSSRYKLTPTIREYIIKERGNKCEVCGFSGENPYTKKTILQVHHKDGDASNTKKENLQVLCPNCHAMTENFGSRNKSSVRKYRKNDYLRIENEVKCPASLTE